MYGERNQMKNEFRLKFLIGGLVILVFTYIYTNNGQINRLPNDNQSSNDHNFKKLNITNDFTLKDVRKSTLGTDLVFSYSYNGELGSLAYVLFKPDIINKNEVEISDRLVTAWQIKPGVHRAVHRLNNPCGQSSKCEASEIEIQFVSPKDFFALKSGKKSYSQLLPVFKEVHSKVISWDIVSLNIFKTFGPEEKLNKARHLLDIGGRSNYLEAKRILDGLIINQPKNIPAYNEMARYHMKVSTKAIGLRRASEVLEISYSIDPEHADTLILQGHVLLRQDKLVHAMEKLTQAKKMGSSNLWLYFNFGNLYQKQKQLDKALNEYRVVIDEARSKPHRNDRAKLAAFEKTQGILESRNEVYSIDRLMKKRASQFSENSCYLSYWAEFKLFRLGEFELALDLANKAISNNCKETIYAKRVYSDTLIVNWHRSDKEQVNEYLNKALALDSDWASRLYRFSTSEELNSTLKFLVSKRIDVDEDDEKGNSALTYAALNNDVNAVKKLLLLGANPNKELKSGFTVFFLSLSLSEPDTIMSFIQSSLPILKTQINGVDALDIAKKRGLDEVIKALSEKSL
jgi:tetratricopeptide (TPR) repeat protein